MVGEQLHELAVRGKFVSIDGIVKMDVHDAGPLVKMAFHAIGCKKMCKFYAEIFGHQTV